MTPVNFTVVENNHLNHSTAVVYFCIVSKYKDLNIDFNYESNLLISLLCCRKVIK